jgi:hypothetical protein
MSDILAAVGTLTEVTLTAFTALNLQQHEMAKI